MSDDWYILSKLGNRSHLGIVLNGLGLLDSAVEIGVNRGIFAREFLHKWKGKNYYGIDPWIDNLPGYLELREKDRQEHYLEAVERLKVFGDRVNLIRKLSVDAAPDFEDESLDFVYIDGNHEQEYVEQDINLWYPKIRNGGIIAGHDIINGDKLGVQLAVKKILFDEKCLAVYVIPGSSWSFYAMKQ